MASVVSVALGAEHSFSKAVVPSINLMVDWGVEGDAHGGQTVQHLSRRVKTPEATNLRQVHLLDEEVLLAMIDLGHPLSPGVIGENILTRGAELLSLPGESRLVFTGGAILRLTGLRNPCKQLERFSPGLMGDLRRRTASGDLNRLAGVMATVETAGIIKSGQQIVVQRPAVGVPLEPV